MKNTSKQLNQISNPHTIYCDKNLNKIKKDLNRHFDHVSTHLFRSEYELFLLRKEIKCLREEYDSYREPSTLVVVLYDKLHDFIDSIPNLQEIDELTKLNKNTTELLNSYRERI